MAKKQEPEVTPVPPKVEAPETRAYLKKQLDTLETTISEANWHIEDLQNQIEKLESQKSSYDYSRRNATEEKDKLMKLYREVGGQEWEITGR